MTFVNPAILWGMFAVSIPILIHIFNLKKTRKIEFSTLMFLKEIQETKQKRIRLKQLLILLCRIAFIIFLVFAFSGPLSKGFLGGSGDASPASVLILLDDSFSMNSRSLSGTDFENAKSLITELVTTLNPGDEIFFTPVSKIDNDEYIQPYREKNSVIDSLKKIKISDTRRSISEIFYSAKRILSASRYQLKEIYFVTDAQSSMFTQNSFETGGIPGKDTRFSFILTSDRTPNNLSVDSIDIKTKIFAPGRIIKLSAAVNNHNNFNVNAKSIVFTCGSYRDEKIIDLPAGTKTTVDFSFTPVRTGFISGKIELTGSEVSDDEILNDNSRNAVFYIPGELNVLIVSPVESDSKYLELALSSSQALITDSSGRSIQYFRVKHASGLNSENPGSFNSVIIINKNSFSPEESSTLKEYLENGGGVIIYPGNDADINNYNEVLNKNLGIPNMLPRHEGPAVFEKADYLHPVFEGVFKTKGNDIKLESPSITSAVSPQQGNNSQTLIRLNTSESFLIQYNIGKGRLLMYAVPPDYSCSNFPDASIFSPLTVRSISFVSRLPRPEESIAGNDYYFDPNEYSGMRDSLGIRTPDRKIAMINIPQASGMILNFRKFLNSSNIYSIESGDATVLEIPVNTDEEESLTARMNPGGITEFMDENYKQKPDVITQGIKLESAVREARNGKMLWQYFVLGALLFLAAEFWLAKSIVKR